MLCFIYDLLKVSYFVLHMILRICSQTFRICLWFLSWDKIQHNKMTVKYVKTNTNTMLSFKSFGN